MLPHKKNEAQDESDGLRAGFEVRVIGESRQAPVPENGNRLEIGLQIGPGQTNAGPDRRATGPVHRLEVEEAPEPLRARPMSELGPAAPYVPRRKRTKRSLTTWTVWMAAGTCTLAVAAVTGVMVARAKQSQTPESAITFVPEESFGKEKAYFLEHTGALTREAEVLLEQYSAATSAEQVLPLVRDASRVRERLTALWQPMGSLAKDLPVETLISDSEARPALILTGTKADFTRFELVFVREGSQLKIDWEASLGIGEAQLPELRNSKAVVKGAKVRVVVQPGGFYTPEFPESDFRSYQLLDGAREEFVWAFVRRSSRTAGLLEAEFNESSVLLEKTNAIPATLRISGPLREGVHLFEITEMLHKGWVSP
ncbi:hypothetical protein OKA05_05760 [Luteolibacter arcticus]|uniref:Anti-sigma factor n=1 Tax=Luteolibacter arcticus TaxID=1581411 RepID=A0ABT3GEK9_9BACT|nr:hypothetical protein [Luteolibacter arcticus]MCW1922049.1 hypothetical protein [Luteolibacter arcticus]